MAKAHSMCFSSALIQWSTQKISVKNVGNFSAPKNKQSVLPWTAAGVLWFNSLTVYLKMMSDSIAWRSVPRSPHSFGQHTQVWTLGISDQLYSSWGSHNPAFQFDVFAKATHRTQGNSYLWLPVYYKDMLKHTNKQPDKAIHRVRSGGVLQELLSLWSWSSLPSPARGWVLLTFLQASMCSSGSSLNPVLLDFYGSFIM